MSFVEMWRSRPEHERRLVATGTTVIGIILVFALIWLPLERTRMRLDAQLPQLRASIAQLKRDAEEVKRLKIIAPTVTGNPTALAALATQGAPTGAQVSVPDDKHVHLVANDVAFTKLLDWLVAVQSTHGLRVENARIESLATTGRVRADVSLTRS
jgi:general secretion pathway protein M